MADGHDNATLIRHCGLYARDLYDLHGESPEIPVDDATTVRWVPGEGAVFTGLSGRELRVPETALDAHPYVVPEETNSAESQ